MKKINLFEAKKELSTRVTDYMDNYVNRAEISATYTAKMKELRNDLKSVKNLEGSFYTHEELTEKIRKVEEKIEKMQEEKDNAIKSANTFTFTEGDKKLKKAINGANYEEIKKAVIEWGKDYNLNLSDTYLLQDIMRAAVQRQDVKTFVKSEGNTNLKYSPQTTLNNMYSVLYTAMINAGTIKTPQIPEILREKYAKKATKKTTK